MQKACTMAQHAVFIIKRKNKINLILITESNFYQQTIITIIIQLLLLLLETTGYAPTKRARL